MRKINYLVLAAFMLLCSNAFTQSTTIFIKALDNNGVLLNGGSVAVGHTNQIEAFSYSQGASSACSAQQVCKATLSDFAFMMALNPATITARQMLLKGLFLTSVDVVYHKSGATFDYYKIHMENVAITSVQESGSSETPTVSVTLMPAKIAWLYTAQKADGSAGAKTKGGWDVGLNIEWNYF
jgi:type VI protein secretion system component Hcp